MFLVSCKFLGERSSGRQSSLTECFMKKGEMFCKYGIIVNSNYTIWMWRLVWAYNICNSLTLHILSWASHKHLQLILIFEMGEKKAQKGQRDSSEVMWLVGTGSYKCSLVVEAQYLVLAIQQIRLLYLYYYF